MGELMLVNVFLLYRNHNMNTRLLKQVLHILVHYMETNFVIDAMVQLELGIYINASMFIQVTVKELSPILPN